MILWSKVNVRVRVDKQFEGDRVAGVSYALCGVPSLPAQPLVLYMALDEFAMMVIMVMTDGVTEPWNWHWPFASLVLRNSTIRDNGDGIVTRHYNQPTNEWLDIFQRFRWETIRMFGLTLANNHYEAIHALSITRYHALYVPTYEELQRALRIAEISYIIEACAFEGNGGGVLAEHNHVEFSNNVWIWQLYHTRFERNVGGGFVIELPKVTRKLISSYHVPR